MKRDVGPHVPAELRFEVTLGFLILPSDVSILPIVCHVDRITLLFHEEVELTLGFGAGKVAGVRVLARVVTTTCIGRESLLKAR